MILNRLFQPRRYHRCRALFRSPLKTHVQLALLRRRPITLALRSGQELTIEKPRSFRRIFNCWLGDTAPPSLEVTLEGTVSFQYDDFQLTLRPDRGDEYVFGEIFCDDVYQLNLLSRPLDTVVDLGANIGLFSLRIARQAQRVVAVESCPDNYKLAHRNITVNGMKERVKLIQAAASGKSGNNVRLHHSRNAGGNSLHEHLAARWPSEGESLVRTISLADIFEEHHIEHCSLLKCDIEGSEYAVIEQAPLNILKRIERCLIEAHPQCGDRPWRGLHHLCGRLRAAGMRLRLEFTSSQTVMLEASQTKLPAVPTPLLAAA